MFGQIRRFSGKSEREIFRKNPVIVISTNDFRDFPNIGILKSGFWIHHVRKITKIIFRMDSEISQIHAKFLELSLDFYDFCQKWPFWNLKFSYH